MFDEIKFCYTCGASYYSDDVFNTFPAATIGTLTKDRSVNSDINLYYKSECKVKKKLNMKYIFDKLKEQISFKLPH